MACNVHNAMYTHHLMWWYTISTTYNCKPCAHMWPYMSRVAGEQQIRELQCLIDETFQQFALDDSEDDFDIEDGDSTVWGGTDSTSNLLSSVEPAVLPTILKDDGMDIQDTLAPLTSSGSLAASYGSGAGTKVRPTRHSLA